MTLLEALRQPTGLLITILISIIMLYSPSLSGFAFDGGAALLRTNLLSTLLISGLIYISITSTTIFYKEMSKGTIINVLSKPIPFSLYYLGKAIGLIASLFVFFSIVTSVSWLSTVIGTPDRASSQINFTPLYFLVGGVLLLSLTALALNYIFNTNIISFIFIGWWISTPLILLAVYYTSEALNYNLPEKEHISEFLKAAILIFFQLLIICSFSVSLSSFSGPILNFVFSFLFLLLGLMSPGLIEQFSTTTALNYTLELLPNFHVFWLAEILSLDREIPLDYLMTSLSYTIALSLVFMFFGIFILLRKDYH
jgi:hypothetical protein